ncbi:MAG: hypothetical protein WEA99_12075 [Brumimicrobium sp.]
MKRILLLNSIIFLSGIMFSQELCQISAKKPEFNANGDPITNIIDHNGAKQGQWYYQDYKKETVLKQNFNNHKCENTYYKNSKGEWVEVVVSQLSSEKELSELNTKIKTYLEKDSIVETDQKQLAIVVNHEKDLLVEVYHLGVWDEKEAIKIENTINEYFENYETELHYETSLFLY